MAETNTTIDSPKAKRVRSPAYPALSLEEALEKAKLLYNALHHHPAPLDLINETWGLKRGGTTGPLYLAALKRYGLVNEIESANQKQFKVTSSAMKILLSPVETDEVRSLKKEAALNPKIFNEIWTHYGGILPSDSVLQYYLLVDKSFNRDAVGNFTRIFRDTIAYANLSPGDKSAEESGPEPPPELSPKFQLDPKRNQDPVVESEIPRSMNPGAVQIATTPVSATSIQPIGLKAPRQQEFTLPVPNGGILIKGPFPLSEADFETFKKAIDLFKVWLVKSDPSGD
jgi:hypothetical protein